MKILSNEQIREADEFTMLNEPISDDALMERAAAKCVDFLKQQWNNSVPFVVFCGPGNNGGDGLVIARLLCEYDYKVIVYCLDSVKYSDGFNLNYERIKKQNLAIVYIISDVKEDLLQYPENAIVVDALFGSGLSKNVTGLALDIIEDINKNNNTVVSIDLPSGLWDIKSMAGDSNAIVHANFTLTFQCPKLSFFFSENGTFVGRWLVLDIGLNKDFIASCPSNYYYVEKHDINSLIRARKRFSHKGTYGHALLLAGSYGKIGAAVMASKACLRAGLGLLTVRIPKCAYQIMQTSIPEAMVSVDENENYVAPFNFKENFNAVGIGPGIGTNDETASMLKFLLQNYQKPMVIDADAINILAQNPTWLSFLPKHSILTPHPKEFIRLVGQYNDDIEKFEMQSAFSQKYNVYVVLKGANTSVSTPEGKIWFNSTGNPGMATAGSGDVLTGILTGLLAQSYSSFETCLLGVWIHGKAGDIAANKFGEISVIASDIINNIGEAFVELGSL